MIALVAGVGFGFGLVVPDGDGSDGEMMWGDADRVRDACLQWAGDDRPDDAPMMHR